MRKGLVLGLMLALAGWAIAADYTGADIDVSALSEEAAAVGRIVSVRVRERMASPAAEGRKLKFVFALDPSLGGDEARVEVRDGVARIRGARPRALLYGAGVLLRQIRWQGATFRVEDGDWSFSPKSALRIAYLARHFHNWYEMATEDELARYVEDLVLWGVNGVHVVFGGFYGVASFERYPSTEAERRELAMTVGLVRRIRSLDLDFHGSLVGNTVPEKFLTESQRAVPNADLRRHPTPGNLCPSAPGAVDLICRELRTAFRGMKEAGLKVDYFRSWPYDSGGCGCAACRPWGSNGYLKYVGPAMDVVREFFPEAKFVISTWYFSDADWKGAFYGWLARHPEVRYILVDDYYKYPLPTYPIDNPPPNGIGIVTFPEISMAYHSPWGGKGANPYPMYLTARLRETEGAALGFEYYSEGIFEDLNKAVVSTVYAQKGPPRYRQALDEYARYELGIDDADAFAELVRQLEGNLQKPNAKDSANALAIAKRLDAAMKPMFAGCWRWRILYLRAVIDYGLTHAADGGADVGMAYSELVEIYKAEKTPGEYGDLNHRQVRPPAPPPRP